MAARAFLPIIVAGLLFTPALAAGQTTARSLYVVRAILEDETLGQTGEGTSSNGSLQRIIETVGRSFAAFDIHDVTITLQDDGLVIIDVSSAVDRQLVEDILGIPADLEFRVPEKGPSPGEEGSVTIIDGRDVVNAISVFDSQTNEPVVQIDFNEDGAEQLANLTTENLGQRLEIVLDGKVLSTAVIQEPILAGRLQLAGGFTDKAAQRLAIQLRSGALPTGFEIVEERLLDQSRPVE